MLNRKTYRSSLTIEDSKKLKFILAIIFMSMVNIQSGVDADSEHFYRRMKYDPSHLEMFIYVCE